MNWYRAKTILIVFFMIMNILLIANIIYSSDKATEVTPDTIRDTVEVLANNGISVDYAAVPSRVKSISSAEAVNIITDEAEFAESVIGTSVKDESGAYVNGGLHLSIDGDYFTLTSETALAGDGAGAITADNAAEKALSLLKKFGFDTGKVKTAVSEMDSGFDVRLTKTVNSLPVYGAEIIVHLSAAGITGFEGSWFDSVSDSSMFDSKISLKSAPSVLVDFISDSSRPQTDISITDITLGYYTGGDEAYHKSIYLIPVWAVATDTGAIYYIDARQSE